MVSRQWEKQGQMVRMLCCDWGDDKDSFFFFPLAVLLGGVEGRGGARGRGMGWRGEGCVLIPPPLQPGGPPSLLPEESDVTWSQSSPWQPRRGVAG